MDEINQRYACGFPFTDGAVLVAREKTYLFTDSRYIEAAEKSINKDICLQMFGVGARLSSLINNALEECGVENLGAEEESLPYSDYICFEGLLNAKLVPAQSIFTELRAAKSAEEQGYMREAQKIAELAFKDVLKIIKPGVSERDIAAEITYRLLKHGAEGNSFDPIAVTGVNSSMPHGVPGDTIVKKGDFVTMDFGCVAEGYCSDMTRCLRPRNRRRGLYDRVYALVRAANAAAIAAARPGITGKALDRVARLLIRKGGFGKCFGHSLGHGVGLEIHEAPYASTKSTWTLKPGMLITIEPGVYLEGNLGVRIEDLVLITETGCEVLSHSEK